MKTIQDLKFYPNVLRVPLVFILVMWSVYFLEIKFQLNFNKLGILPLRFKGLIGIFLSPFIHADTKHLLNNTLPFAVLCASLFYFYKKVASRVLLIGLFFTGLLTWLIARPSYHIGASGVIYLLFSFVFFSGVFKKHYRLVALSLIVVFLYGSMIWYVLPIKDGVSWEGHLSGFLVGLVLSILYKHKGIVKEKFEFSQTEFDTFFDEDGNYIPPVVEDETIEEATFDISENLKE